MVGEGVKIFIFRVEVLVGVEIYKNLYTPRQGQGLKISPLSVKRRAK